MDGIAHWRKTVRGGMPAPNTMTLRMLPVHGDVACIGHKACMTISTHA